LGEFHHSKDGFLMGPINKKGARFFWENKKNTNGASWRMKRVLYTRSKK